MAGGIDRDGSSTNAGQGAARLMGGGALLYALLLIVNVVTTTDGPDPVEAAAREAARIAAHATAIRWSGLLGLLGALAFGGFGVGAALLTRSRGREVLATLIAAASVTTAALWACSFAALIASAQAAQGGLSSDATVLMGHLHSTSLIAGFAPAGGAVLLCCAAGLFGRMVRVVGTVPGVAGVVACTALLSSSLDRGPLGFAVVVVFLGLPLWLLLVAAVVLTSTRRSPGGQRNRNFRRLVPGGR